MSLARLSTIFVVIFVAASAWIIMTPISGLLPEATDHAESIDFLFKFMSVASVAVFLIVEGLLLYFVLRYRKKPTDVPDAIGADIHGNTRLEIIWSVIPAIFLVILTAMSGKVYADIITQHSNAYKIDAIAFQFGWECDHPKYNIKEFQTCHMPIGQTRINLHAKDVIHSFWVPEFRVKQDAVPGYPTGMNFKTTRVGKYRLICAELCGVGHSEMYAKLYVCDLHTSPTSRCDEQYKSFDAWVAGQKQSAGGPSGNVSFKSDIQTIFAAHCAACHIQGQLGGLNLGNYAGLLKGGNVLSGSVIKPGSHKASILWNIVQPTAPWPAGNRMPLGGPYLQQSEIDRIAAWIDQGAKNN